ncbi:MAG: uracil-DNA glycosylase [Spirochaetales bacterium]|nr:uracil-DNA glycosylase [Spirochaetales bacterium]
MSLKKEEKQQLYNLLKTSDSYILGYQRDIFAGEPQFSDDAEVSTEQSSAGEKNSFASVQTSASSETSAATARTFTGAENSFATAHTPADTENSFTAPAASDNSQNHSLTLEELNAKMLRCTRCSLARTRNNVVPGQGVSNPLVLVIGEAPGADEDMKGLPFVGKAGVLLDKMLGAIHLDRNSNCYIANTVKCRPPENRNPLPEESQACKSFLEAQIHILKPKMILCMGKVAAEDVLNESFSITQNHGRFYEKYSIPVMATYHPSALLRDESLKKPAWEDLKAFRRELDKICSTSR